MSEVFHTPAATVLAQLPGTDMAEIVTMLRGELGAPHRSVLPVLSARSDVAGAVPRTVAMMTELWCDLQPHGWRLGRTPGRESRAAEALLASDVNIFADVIGGESGGDRGPVTVECVGPVSLAAQLYLHNGERVLSDHGARRDVGESLADGLGGVITWLRRCWEQRDVVIRCDETWLHRVLSGTIPTVSGYRTLRAVPMAEAWQMLCLLAEAARAHGAFVELVIPAGQDPQQYGTDVADTVFLQHPGSNPQCWEPIAGLIENGMGVGVMMDQLAGQQQAVGAGLSITDMVHSITKPWLDLGLSMELIGRVVVAPGAGLKSMTPQHVRRAVQLATDLAQGLHETARNA